MHQQDTISKLSNILQIIKDERENREKIEQNLISTVGSAIEQHALQNGLYT